MTGQKVVGTEEGEESSVDAAPMGARKKWPWETYINAIPAVSVTPKEGKMANVRMNKDYSFGLSNYEIGRAAEHAGIPQNQFRRSRWIAWRKSSARKARNALTRKAKGKKGQKKARAKQKA